MEVLAESLETAFDDEAHFIVNLHNFFQPIAFPWHSCPKNEPFLPHPLRQNSEP